MYIAICDDNVADRKHLERLLSRESDKRAGTPNILYVDSYGKKEHFLNNAQKYDLIFLDMVSTPTLAEEIVMELQKLHVSAPIVMYSSQIDYTQNKNLPDSIVHRKKPYIPDPLPELLKLGDAHVTGKVVSILLTVNKLKQEIAISEIHYIYADHNICNVVLRNGPTVQVEEDLQEICLLLEPYEEFYRLKKDVVINARYITLLTYLSVTMQDYQGFYYKPWKYSEIKFLKDKMDSSS